MYMAQYTAKRHQDSAMSHYLIAASQEKLVNNVDAIRTYEASLRIDPGFDRAKTALEKIKNQ